MNDIITRLRLLDVELSMQDTKLVINSARGVVTRELLDEIKEHKEAIIAYLNNVSRKRSFASIPLSGEKKYYKTSAAQKRLYFLYELDRTSQAYNIPQALWLEGRLDEQLLERAFAELVTRHESLRTFFGMEEDEPVQKIAAAVNVTMEHYSGAREAVPALIQNFTRRFSLNAPPLWRIGLIRISPDENVLLLDMHHIITDGISVGILTKEFMSLYNGLKPGPLKIQYRDFAEWQQSPAQQGQIARQREFWLKTFSEEPQALDLPADFPRPVIKSYEGACIKFEITAAETSLLKHLAKTEGATLFMTVLSLYSILLSRLGSQDDIVIGTPVSGRQHADLESTIGMFVNILPVRSYPQAGMSFREFLSSVRSQVLACFDNQEYQYEQLLDDLKIVRNTGRNPLFDAFFEFTNFDTSTFSIPGLTARTYDVPLSTSKFDISLSAWESGKQLFFHFEYCTALFKSGTIEKFIAYFRKILTAVTGDPGIRLSTIDILTGKEKQQLLYEFNDTQADQPEPHNILALFDRQVEKTPQQIALRFGKETISYRSLQQLSEKVSCYLQQERGVRQGELVGVMLERDMYIIPVIFGILRAGAVYVPIDPFYPGARIQSIVEGSGLDHLFTRTKYAQASGVHTAKLIDLDFVWPSIESMAAIPAADLGDNDQSAYIIHTSGSTGVPKAVVISHRSLLNIIQCLQQKYPLGEKDCYLFKTSICFDVSEAEIFGWFHSGGSLSILEPAGERDPAIILDAIEKHSVTHVNFVPSAFSTFLDELESNGFHRAGSLKYIFLAGEALPFGLAKRYLALGMKAALENIYGPTESTIYSCAYSIHSSFNKFNIPIGKPLHNIRLYITNGAGNLQPVGVKGELCIAGKSLAKEYLFNATLTSEKFISVPALPETRVYKTGDLARWLPDGNIEFLGRLDTQVKIRGYRIELGEIESRLSQHEKIKEVLVVLWEGAAGKSLVAYYSSDEEPGATVLKEYLSRQLPEYMVPGHFVYLKRFPLNANGKIDRKGLPLPDLQKASEYIPASNQVQENLVQIWSELLNIDKDQISIYANFFDLGGNSINMIALSRKLEAVFACSFPVIDIFRYPTILRMEEYVSKGATTIGELSTTMEEAMRDAGKHLRILEGL